jgi:Iron-containing redox enzyme
VTADGAGRAVLAPETTPPRATPSIRLRRKISLAIGPFASASARLVTDPRLRELWPKYLVTQHGIIRATVPLTEVAAERACELTDDPLAGALVRYLETHADEERNHDDSLLNDLELLGIERATVLAQMPSPAVASLVGCHYYWALHYHPVAVLGYVAVMEGYPPAPGLIDELIARSGYARKTFSTIAEHAVLDPHHRDRLDQTLDSLPLTRAHERILGVSAIATAGLAARVLEELITASAGVVPGR